MNDGLQNLYNNTTQLLDKPTQETQYKLQNVRAGHADDSCFSCCRSDLSTDTWLRLESFHFKTKTNKIIIEKYYWEKSEEKNYLVFKVKSTSSRNHHQSLKMKLVFLLKNAAFSQDFSNIIQFSERKLRDLTFGFSLRYLCISKFSYKTLKEYTI